MHKFIWAAFAVFLLSACTATQKGAAVGTAVGAGVGALATDSTKGAIIGGVVGGVAGGLIGRNRDGSCTYRDANGRTYRAAC